MTKWIVIFLLLCNGSYAQQQFTVYIEANYKEQRAGFFEQTGNASQLPGLQMIEDTSINQSNGSGDIMTLQDYKKALVLNPRDTLLLYHIGHCYAADTSYQFKDSALKYYNKAINYSHAFYEAYLDRGYLYALQFGNNKKAHKDFEKSIEIKPENSLSHLYNGMLYYNEKEYKKAMEMYNKAIELNADFGEAYYERSRVWYVMGINTMVCSDLDKASTLGFAQAVEAKKVFCQ